MRLKKERWLRPVILHLTATNRCNLKCLMCNIWRHQPKEDISSAVLAKVRNSPLARHLKILDITGGEPFLSDIEKIISELGGERFRVVLISTNGILTEKIIMVVRELLKRYPFNLVVDVSIDGTGSLHDKIRGVEGTFCRAEATLKELVSLAGELPRLRPTVKFTILRGNCDQLLNVYSWARKLGAAFTVKPGAEFGFLDNIGDDYDLSPAAAREVIGQMEKMLKDEKRSIPGFNFWSRLYWQANIIFHRELIEYLRKTFIEKEKCVPVRCYSSSISVLIHNNGKIYNCPTLMKPVGDLKEQSLEEIWWGKEMERTRRFIASGKCACFSQCDQMPSLVVKYNLGLAWKIAKSYFASVG